MILNQKALSFNIDFTLLKPEYLPEYSCEYFRFYGVDGKYLRDVIHLNYTQGGNYLRYPWIGRNEGWLDIDNRREWAFIALHELHEVNYAVDHYLNLLDDTDYGVAHEEANKIEQVARDNPEMVMQLIQKELAEMMDTKSFKSNTTGDIRIDLAQSMLDEAQAASDYRKRAQICLIQGDNETAKLYEHIASEEDVHYNEMKVRYNQMTIKNYAVKFYDEEQGIVEGLGIPYNGPMNGKDLQGEYFTEKTDFTSPFYDGKAIKSMQALYHHGLDPDIKDMPTGDVIEASDTPMGKWVKIQLDKANKYYEAIKYLIKMGKLEFSSGAIPPGVKKAADGFIEKWPWKEMSFTPAPANPLAEIEGIKTGEATLTAVLEKINKENKIVDTKTTINVTLDGSKIAEAVKSIPASPAANNLPSVPMKPDPAVSAEANGHVPGKNAAAPPECACKAIKCTSCGKDVQWPEEVVKQLQALGESVQTVLASIGATPQSGPSEAAPAGDQPAKPSMPPSDTQGMAPENHEASPDASPKPESPSAEKPATEPEKPGETEPDEDDKKPVKTEGDQVMPMKCAKCGMSMDKCKCKSDSAKAFDIMENPTVKALVKELETVKERVKTLEALPISNGPAKSAIKAADNPHMENNSALLDDMAREKFYDELASDTTVNYPTRQAAAMKAQELSLKRTIAKGPQPLKQ